MADAWNPTLYERFRDERLRPALDLIALVRPWPGMRALDLGCGTGEPTERLLAHLGSDASIEGVDSSPAMLARAAARATDRLSFRRAEIESIGSFARWDLVFSNAALHWVADHEAFFGRLLATLPPRAQVAIQIPRNHEHPAHRAAEEVASRAPFSSWLGGFVQRSGALRLERYAELFFEHGFTSNELFERVYSHELAGSASVVEWTRATLLVPYLERLEGAQADELLAAYSAELRRTLGHRSPYLYCYRRMFLWGLRAGPAPPAG